MSMEVLYPYCCGLDVHKRTVVACLITPDAAGKPRKQVRTFGTMTDDLLGLADWLRAHGCGHVAMESTGILWKPVYNVLEAAGVQVLLVNARHIKAVPGRKTDVHDAEWIADLLQHGLLRGSFIPDQAQRELRDLTRTRTTLVDERSAVVKRLQKVLEDANLKLTGVATDIMGVSGRAILAALVDGATDPAALAELAKGKLRRKQAELERALAGRVRAHHRQLLALHLSHIDFLDESIEQLSREIAARLRPVEEELDRLDSIHGVGRTVAEVFAAEVGLELGRFPSAGHLASWAGMCPGNRESAGKRQSGRTRPGNKWLRRALTEAAQAAARTRGSALAAQYRRVAVRRGKRKATVAVGHAILRIAYHLLTRGTMYDDAGRAERAERQRRQAEQRAVRQLQALGYSVTLTPTAKEAA
jgi:transposase